MADLLAVSHTSDQQLYKVPYGRLQPFVVEDTHIQSLMPVFQGNISDVPPFLPTGCRDERITDTGFDEIQRSLNGVNGADHIFVGQGTAGPFLEGTAEIVVKNDLRLVYNILGLDLLPVCQGMLHGKGNVEILLLQLSEMETSVAVCQVNQTDIRAVWTTISRWNGTLRYTPIWQNGNGLIFLFPLLFLSTFC